MGFTVSEIANKNLLGFKVHRNIITNFTKREMMITTRRKYTELSNAELSIIVKELSDRNVNSGYREINAFLANRTPPVIVQMARVNSLLREIDPVGTARRWTLGIKRRSYRVPTANYLWHLDTHHKLIRWNFVLNGCIDGYSRLVTHLGISTDNFAITTLNFFFESIREYAIYLAELDLMGEPNLYTLKNS